MLKKKVENSLFILKVNTLQHVQAISKVLVLHKNTFLGSLTSFFLNFIAIDIQPHMRNIMLLYAIHYHNMTVTEQITIHVEFRFECEIMYELNLGCVFYLLLQIIQKKVIM